MGELKARLRALTRRDHDLNLSAKQRFEIDGLLLNAASREVSREGVPINLRRKEFSLLECLMSHAGTVVTREALARYAWDGANQPWNNTVDVHIKYLRDKIDRPFNRPMIKTVHGLGYRLDYQPDRTATSAPA